MNQPCDLLDPHGKRAAKSWLWGPTLLQDCRWMDLGVRVKRFAQQACEK